MFKTFSQGILFDLPYATESAQKDFENSSLLHRLEFAPGSFLEAVPKSQTYILKHIIHDWEDKKCLIILKNIRKNIPDDGKLFIIE